MNPKWNCKLHCAKTIAQRHQVREVLGQYYEWRKPRHENCDISPSLTVHRCAKSGYGICFLRGNYTRVYVRTTTTCIQPYLTKSARGNVEIPKGPSHLPFQSPGTAFSADKSTVCRYTKQAPQFPRPPPHTHKMEKTNVKYYLFLKHHLETTRQQFRVYRVKHAHVTTTTRT